MEWILILVLNFQGTTAPTTMAVIGGFKTEAACKATLKNVISGAVAADGYSASPMIAGEMFKYSLCVQRAK